MTQAWTEKYRPQTLKDIVGNSKALEELVAWARAWEDGTPDLKAVILAGEPGVGKTTAAMALARDMGWGYVELNASDARNADAINRVAGRSALNMTLTGLMGGDVDMKPRRQLIVLDEADNLFGNEDRGGMKAITDIIRATGQPVILIANDLYELTRRGAALKSLAHTIKFTRVHTRSIPKALARIAKAEDLEVDPDALEALAERAGGDMRSAVNDLSALATGRTQITFADVESLGKRDAKGDVWGLLGKVFYGSSFDEARKATWDLDEDPETIALWYEENLPQRYGNPRDVVEGFKWLSRGDVYLGRVRRRQQYGLWSYATEVMTGGVLTAKSEKPVPGMHAFPSWLRKQSQSKGVRELRDRVARKVGALTHTSARVARISHFPLFRGIMQEDDQFAVWAIVEMDLEADEVAFLLETKETTARVKKLLAAAEAKRAAAPRPQKGAAGGLGGFGGSEEEAAPVEKPKARGRKKKGEATDDVAALPEAAPAPLASSKAAEAPPAPAERAAASVEKPAAAPEPAKVEAPTADSAEEKALDGPRKQKRLFDY